MFEALPQNILLIMPDTSIVFKRFVQAENNSLNVRLSVEFKRSYYTAASIGTSPLFIKNYYPK